MSKDVSRENLLRAFPYALSRDSNMIALASVAADELQQLYNDCDKLTIYTNIFQLDEELLDILARDYKVDWYLYEGTVETKRSQINSSIYVHRHLGTKGALIFALSDICPGTDIEEWFEYGGKPYYFRIVLDVTEQRLPVSQDLIERIVDVVKPARAVLEDDSIVYRSRDYLRIGDTSGYALYHIRACGTYPNASKQGRIEYEVVLISSDSGAVKYSAPRTGEIKSGTFPNPAMQGGVEDGNILFESSGAASAYHARMCGTALGSL